jgi:hypothetical protein
MSGGLITALIPFIKQQMPFGDFKLEQDTLVIRLSEEDLKRMFTEATSKSTQFRGFNLAPFIQVSIEGKAVVLKVKVI